MIPELASNACSKPDSNHPGSGRREKTPVLRRQRQGVTTGRNKQINILLKVGHMINYIAALAAGVFATNTSWATINLFDKLGSTDPAHPAAVTAKCDRAPEGVNTFTCEFTKQRFMRPLTDLEIRKKEEQMRKLFSDMREEMKKEDPEKNEFCRFMQSPSQEIASSPDMMQLVDLMRRICRGEDAGIVMEQEFQKRVADMKTTCTVPAPVTWKTTFVRNGPRLFKSEPASAFSCGEVRVETLEMSERGGLFEYTITTAYMDRRNKQWCADKPEQVTETYSWKTMAKYPAQCSSIVFEERR